MTTKTNTTTMTMAVMNYSTGEPVGQIELTAAEAAAYEKAAAADDGRRSHPGYAGHFQWPEGVATAADILDDPEGFGLTGRDTIYLEKA
ncbi:MAG: hypothetical protein ACRC7O_06260 [Fimbriiglobus sp.]